MHSFATNPSYQTGIISDLQELIYWNPNRYQTAADAAAAGGARQGCARGAEPGTASLQSQYISLRIS